jgi:hypothetical protein
MMENRAMCILLALVMASTAAPASAQLALPPAEDNRPASRLAPIAMDSPWYERLDAAGQAVALTLGRGPDGGWESNFGGRWLAATDRARIAALLSDDRSAYVRVLGKAGAYEQVVLGWTPPEGGDAYAALADRPEADAIICWREVGDAAPWPITAAEAEVRARHACVRISYSIRFDPPQWRAFIDAPPARGD